MSTCSPDDIPPNLKMLALDACSDALNAEQRILVVEYLFRRVLSSKKLWRSKAPYYEDALQEALEYCFQNLEEYVQKYIDVQTFMTWVNDWIIKKLRLYRDRQNSQRQRQTFSPLDSGGYDPLQQLPARDDSNLSLAIWDELMEWINADLEKNLQNRVCKRFPHINAQCLLVRKLSLDNASWEIICQDLKCPPIEAKYLAQWYSRHCYPLLRSWGMEKGYLNNSDVIGN
ncbi:MAG: hypothetical protein HC799_10630 [Limnothrix sp. RL_2_0]|nr:hypothetical protein [Limnothrix sp. RL_2_0]